MNFELYNQRMSNIATALDHISKRTHDMALLKIADERNLEFVALMEKFDALTLQADQLISKMEQQIKGE